MRQIGTLPTVGDAGRLADYLLAQGIKTRVEDSAAGAALWVFDEDQVARANEALAEYTRDPHDARYDDAAKTARDVEKQTAQKEAAYRKNVVDVRSRWETGRMQQRPITLALMAISVVVAVITQFGEQRDPWVNRLSIAPVHVNGEWYQYLPGLTEICDGQLWRLITPIFIHFGLPHLLFNMFALVDVGSQVEMRRGWLRMLLLVLALAITSNLGQYLAEGPTFGGMSGVVYGLFGYVWMKSRYEPLSGFVIHSSTVAVLLIWFVLCMTGAVGSIANWAHGVGLVVGMLIGAGPTLAQRLRRG